MAKLENFQVTAWFGVTAGVFTWLFGYHVDLLRTMVLFVVLDYLTGVISAGKRGELSAQVGYWGIVRKVGLFVVVVLAVQLDRITGQQLISLTTIYFLIANEGLSILDNLGELGVPIPLHIRKLLHSWQEKGEREDIIEEVQHGNRSQSGGEAGS